MADVIEKKSNVIAMMSKPGPKDDTMTKQQRLDKEAYDKIIYEENKDNSSGDEEKDIEEIINS